ncbi:DUF4190 domain-containing protein [Pseudonocardia bannensis]|uniref:DUF4190 domain-containing protein n=1 Tax=Pseudonocardia bannensis TaxID=630973 RepID=A0A848DGL7_9PSEU|nr:DUF4190 domain-containing protein [Pseudonocardia bannensis]NMH91810.1 DUF4190 domain-containing protein [Pseudonocardia bannensis]
MSYPQQPGHPFQPGRPAPSGYDVPPAGYGPYPPYPPGPHAWYVGRPTNAMAIVCLVFGVLRLFWLGSVLALVLGYVARSQIRQTGEGGDGLAVAGIVLGRIGIGFLAIGMFFAAL